MWRGAGVGTSTKVNFSSSAFATGPLRTDPLPCADATEVSIAFPRQHSRCPLHRPFLVVSFAFPSPILSERSNESNSMKELALYICLFQFTFSLVFRSSSYENENCSSSLVFRSSSYENENCSSSYATD